MTCESNLRAWNINLRRLLVLVGLAAVIIAVSVASVLVIPAFISVLPLLFFVAMCPLMCVAHRLVSWVKGGAKVRERIVFGDNIPEVRKGTEERPALASTDSDPETTTIALERKPEE